MRGVAADRRWACDRAEVSGNRWLPRTTCVGCAAGCSGAFLPPPSPPAEKATARQDQAGKASTGDGAGDGRGQGSWKDPRRRVDGHVVERRERDQRREKLGPPSWTPLVFSPATGTAHIHR